MRPSRWSVSKDWLWCQGSFWRQQWPRGIQNLKAFFLRRYVFVCICFVKALGSVRLPIAGDCLSLLLRRSNWGWWLLIHVVLLGTNLLGRLYPTFGGRKRPFLALNLRYWLWLQEFFVELLDTVNSCKIFSNNALYLNHTRLPQLILHLSVCIFSIDLYLILLRFDYGLLVIFYPVQKGQFLFAIRNAQMRVQWWLREKWSVSFNRSWISCEVLGFLIHQI